MQRKRSGIYRTGSNRYSHPAVSLEPESHDPHRAVLAGKFSGKDFFSDLRVEVDREIASKHSSQHAHLRSKASIIRSSASSKVPKPVANASYNAAVAIPSQTRQLIRRCQSASAVRTKLINAVEQGSSSGGYQHSNHKLQAQIDTLRNLASAHSKMFSKSQSGYRTPSAEPTSASSSILYGTSRMATGPSATSCTSQNQDECIAGVRIGPGRASCQISASNTSSSNQVPSVLVGGYRSSSVQLEVELVERLNEIGRSNLPEKTLSRTRACQGVLDNIVQQDEPYGRLLSRIRDEFSTYVDMTSRKSPLRSGNNNASKIWCACGQDVFEFALVKQENVVLKKRVNSMQQELEALQAELRQARMESRSDRSARDTSSDWLEDGQAEEDDDLDNIQLFAGQNANESYIRPQVVPMLSFASLPEYSDEEDEEEGSY